LPLFFRSGQVGSGRVSILLLIGGSGRVGDFSVTEIIPL